MSKLSSSTCQSGSDPGHLRRQIQWLLFFRVLFLSLMLGTGVLLQATMPSGFLPPVSHFAYFIAALYLLTIFSALSLRLIRHYLRFAYLQVVLDSLLITVLVLFTGGSQSVFTVVYFFPIVMGAFIFSRRGPLFIATFCTLLFGSMLISEYGGNTFIALKTYPGLPSDPQTLLNLFVIYSLTFYLVAILSSMLSARLQKTEAELLRTTSNYDQLSSLYKQIFDDISTGIITIRANGLISSFNRAAEQITAYSRTELAEQPISLIFPGLEKYPSCQRRHTALIARKTGEVIPVGYSCTRLNSPENDEQGSVYTLQDLSLIKKMEAQVQQAEKMATIGEMAAGIAHELRNPLAAISGAVQLLDQETGMDHANKRLFAIILREADRLDKTIHDFLIFSRPVNPEKEWFPLLSLVQEAIETLGQDPCWERGLRFKLEIDPGLECWGDPQLIRQVLINLVSNGGNACRNTAGGEIIIKGEEHAGKETEESCAAVTITVADSGQGIAEELREKIFEPFFTTRENGTGLGLAIVRQIVHSHGGEIYANNRIEGGAAISVRLPLP